LVFPHNLMSTRNGWDRPRLLPIGHGWVMGRVCQQETSRSNLSLFYYVGCRQHVHWIGGPGEPNTFEEPNTFSGFALVCVWAVIGILLTAAAIWFGVEIYGGLF
jgi:hypothetical protein